MPACCIVALRSPFLSLQHISTTKPFYVGVTVIRSVTQFTIMPDSVRKTIVYSYFNLLCRIKASRLQDKTEEEYGILTNK